MVTNVNGSCLGSNAVRYVESVGGGEVDHELAELELTQLAASALPRIDCRICHCLVDLLDDGTNDLLIELFALDAERFLQRPRRPNAGGGFDQSILLARE